MTIGDALSTVNTGQNQRNRGKKTHQTNSAEAGVTIPIQRFNEMCSSLNADKQRLMQQVKDLEAVKLTLESQVRTLMAPVDSNDNDDESKVNSTAKVIKGITSKVMLSLLKDSAEVLEDFKALDVKASGLRAETETIYKYSADWTGFIPGQKSSKDLMQDLGVCQDGDKIKYISGGLVERFEEAREQYGELAPIVNKYIELLTNVKLTGKRWMPSDQELENFCLVDMSDPAEWKRKLSEHNDNFKLCEDRLNMFTLTKNNTDLALTLARSNSDWVYDRHYDGVGQTKATKQEKLLKFEIIL